MSSIDTIIIAIAAICAGVPLIVAIVLAVRGNHSKKASPATKAQPNTFIVDKPRQINGRYDVNPHPFKQGGMAAIWLATERKSGRQCVIKTPRHGTSMDHVYLEKLALEADFLKRLSHPGIVKYLDDFTWKEEFHLVMEYVDGETLMALSPRCSPGEEKVIDWAYQVLDILSYVHAAGIIHRDINPKNILLLPDGTVKLIDFGTARDLNAVSKDKMPWAPFTQIANRGFDIPELFLGNASDQHCDLCGLAQTCIYLLTLKQPNDLCHELIHTSWPRTYREAAIVAGYLESDGVSRRVARCLSQAILFAPTHRFADARAMQSALSAASGCQVPAVEAATKK